MKKAVIPGIFLLLAILGGLAGSQYINNLLNPAHIAEQSRLLLGKPIELAQKPDWGIFPPSIMFHNLEWQFETTSMSGSLEIAAGEIKLELLPLLQGRYVFSEASFKEPSLRLKPVETKAAKENSAAVQAAKSAVPYLLKKLEIVNGCVKILAETDNFSFSYLNISAENIAPETDATFKSDFSFNWSQANEATAAVSGKSSISAQFNFSPTLFTLEQADLSFSPGENSQASPFAVKLAGDLDLRTLDYRLSEVAGEYRNWRFSLTGQGKPGDFSGKAGIILKDGANQGQNLLSASASAQFSESSLLLRNLDIEILGNHGNGAMDAHFRKSGSQPQLTGQLDFSVLDLGRLFETPSAPIASTGEGKPTALPFPDLELQINAAKLQCGKLAFTNIHLPFHIRDNVATIPAAHFNWAKGVADATFTTDLVARTSDLRLHADHLDMGAALAELGLNGISGGSATISTHLAATGANWQEITGSLAGNIQIAGREAAIDALRKIASSLPTFLEADNLIPDTVDKVSAQCAANNGILYCRNLNLATNNLSGAGSASIDLHDNNVNGSLRFRIGKLDLPITFRGPLNDISWRPGAGFLEQLRKLLP